MFAWPVGFNRNLALYSINLRVGRSDHEEESCNADCRDKSVHELQILNKFGDIHRSCLSEQRAQSFNISDQVSKFNGRNLHQKTPSSAREPLCALHLALSSLGKSGLQCSQVGSGMSAGRRTERKRQSSLGQVFSCRRPLFGHVALRKTGSRYWHGALHQIPAQRIPVV